MKTLNLYKLIILFFAVTMISSCVKDDDYDVPNIVVVEPDLGDTPVITVNNIASAWEQEQGNVTFETEQYLEGYVVSNDEFGNFFEEIIIQDNLENPTTGIRVLIDESPLFTRFEIGRKIYINLQDLTVGISNGVLTLGIGGGTYIEAIPAPRLENDVILRSAEVATIVPLEINLSDLPSLNEDEDAFRLTNRLVKINNVQFNRNDVLGDNPLTYAGEQSDEFDGERSLESCDSGSTIVFSTSTFADFKSVTMPSGRGSVTGILTKNFFGDTFNFVINDVTGVNLDNEDRCDPDFFSCTTPSGGGATFYEDDFESYGDFSDAESAGWTNVNVSGGNTEWELGNFSNSNYAQISGFTSGEDEINVWLVSPSIDMDNTTGEELLFDVQSNYDNGNILTVLFSSDFSGDVTAATWQSLDAAIPNGPSGGFGDFETVGPINISCLDGSINIAFLYEGSDPSATTRYHVDNFTVTGN
ncbi:MAG: choice-of-anchor J domain-containing protein [Flavobacteriaceae bacterium]|nr:choice-of-anchor J domain-containing protein [Flavobacteriaceae bacterium]